jgi:hypothetical protein
MSICSRLGIYKIDWIASGRVKAWLPRLPFDSKKIILREIRVLMMWDPTTQTTIRKVGNRSQVESDEDLRDTVLKLANAYRTPGESEPHVVIDALSDVPWENVIHVVEFVREAKIETVLFEPPLEPPSGARGR